MNIPTIPICPPKKDTIIIRPTGCSNNKNYLTWNDIKNKPFQNIDKTFFSVDTSGNITLSKDLNNNINYLNITVNEIKADSNIQPDWNQNDETKKDYIKNRPFYEGTSVENLGTTFEGWRASCQSHGEDSMVINANVAGIDYQDVEGLVQTDTNGRYVHYYFGENRDYRIEVDRGMAQVTIRPAGTEYYFYKVSSTVKQIDPKYLPFEQADWNQNDDTKKDYVKGRTHWVEEKTILEETTFTIEESADSFAFGNFPVTLSAGDICNVMYDGEAYTGTPYVWEDSASINLGEFLVYFQNQPDGLCAITIYSYPGEHTISILQKVYHPIPDEYIPNWVASIDNIMQPDWNQNDETAKDYIKGRPGGYYGEITTTTLAIDAIKQDESDKLTDVHVYKDNFEYKSSIDVEIHCSSGTINRTLTKRQIPEYVLSEYNKDIYGNAHLIHASQPDTGEDLAMYYEGDWGSTYDIGWHVWAPSLPSGYLELNVTETKMGPVPFPSEFIPWEESPTATSVLYTAQSLTDVQKNQARANIGAGTPYTLPQATAEAIGGVKADSAEAADTQPVRIGVDGKLYTAPGNTDISLGLTSAAVGQTIKVKAVDASGKPTAWEAADMPSGGGSDGGLSANEKTLLLTLLKNAKYAENVQPAYEQLESLFNGGAIVTYTVTNNLTDLTTDNEAATITAGFPYKATLADADGNKPKSVEVVMGGVDVSGEYYADGVIDIPSVSGELVITAFAKNTYPVIYNLANTPVTCNADLYEDTGLAFGSESADGYTKSWTMVVKVKNVSAGYLWCVNGQKALSSYYENRWNSDAGDKVMTINTYICNTRVSSGITQANPDEVCIVITKEALSQKTATVHYLSWAGEYVADTVTGTYAQFFNSAYAANMMIGGQTGADFVGTIEEFVIYEGIMQEDEIKVVLGV